jgi:hypothetical protein
MFWDRRSVTVLCQCLPINGSRRRNPVGTVDSTGQGITLSVGCLVKANAPESCSDILLRSWMWILKGYEGALHGNSATGLHITAQWAMQYLEGSRYRSGPRF